ncbi:hypothetical protein LC593_19240 [Nostoc sp. CHAB 5844]|nr:hypothetical protein [Nostoc sp. CHAB 5844]
MTSIKLYFNIKVDKGDRPIQSRKKRSPLSKPKQNKSDRVIPARRQRSLL